MLARVWSISQNLIQVFISQANWFWVSAEWHCVCWPSSLTQAPGHSNTLLMSSSVSLIANISALDTWSNFRLQSQSWFIQRAGLKRYWAFHWSRFILAWGRGLLGRLWYQHALVYRALTGLGPWVRVLVGVVTTALTPTHTLPPHATHHTAGASPGPHFMAASKQSPLWRGIPRIGTNGPALWLMQYYLIRTGRFRSKTHDTHRFALHINLWNAIYDYNYSFSFRFTDWTTLILQIIWSNLNTKFHNNV